jgi:hypothetical protein
MTSRTGLLALASLLPAAPAAADAVDALWGGLWRDNPAIGRCVVLAIAVLGIAGVHAAMIHLRRYRREEAGLDRVRGNLAEWRSAQSGGARTAPETDGPSAGETAATAAGESDEAYQALAPPDRLREGLPAGTAIGGRLDLIESLCRDRQSIDIALIQQLGAAHDETRPGLATPAFAAAISMLLGILGTFAGLAIMVQQIDLGLPDVSAAGVGLFEQAFADLRSVLGGMKTAFSTSLVGMSCALLCSTLDFRLRRRQAAFFARLEHFTVAELLPATLPGYDDDKLLARVSDQLDHSFGRLEEIQRLNQRTIEDLSGVQTGFAAMVEEIRTITRGEAARDLDRVIEELEKTNRSVLAVAEQVPRLIASAKRRSHEMLARLEQLAAPAPFAASSVAGGLLTPRTLLIAIVALAVLIVVTRF